MKKALCFLTIVSVMVLMIGTSVMAGTDYASGSGSINYISNKKVTAGVCVTVDGTEMAWSFDVYGIQEFMDYNPTSSPYYEFKKGSTTIKGGSSNGDITCRLVKNRGDYAHDDEFKKEFKFFLTTISSHVNIYAASKCDIDITAKTR